MSAHTPGPWVAGNPESLIFGAQRGDGMEPIGFVYGPSRPECSEVGQRAIANARLIAAAPELLEALEAICDELANDDDFSARQIARHAGRAAIAKAKGDA